MFGYPSNYVAILSFVSRLCVKKKALLLRFFPQIRGDYAKAAKEFKMKTRLSVQLKAEWRGVTKNIFMTPGFNQISGFSHLIRIVKQHEEGATLLKVKINQQFALKLDLQPFSL